jgi:hypothetical protein
MSTTYSEIYSTKLREQSKILKGENNSPSKNKSQYVTLIKKFKKKERSSSMTKMKVKPRRINAKILKMSKSNFNYKNKTKKKTKSKQKLENSQKLKMDFSKEEKNERINTINQRNQKYNNGKSKSMENYEKGLNDYSTRQNENDIRSKIKYDLENLNKNKNDDYIFYKTLQNNNYNNYVKISKTYNDNSFKKYFDIFKLKQQAIKARDEIKYNFWNINKSNLNLHKNSDINKMLFKINTFSDYLPNKTKTLFKAKKLKEDLENTINGNYRAYSSQNLRNKQNHFLNGNLKEKKENNKNDGNYERNNDNDNDNNNDNNEVNNFSYHFFDKNIKMPKKIKKYANTNCTNYTNCTNTEMSKTINENNLKGKLEKRNDKNMFRNNTNISTDNYKTNKITLNNPGTDTSLIGVFSPKIYIQKYKNEFKDYNSNYLNSITQENSKLANLLMRIPSNRKNKERSYDLMDYIAKLSKNNIKKDFLPNKKSFNNFEPIYPINKCINLIKIQNNQ